MGRFGGLNKGLSIALIVAILAALGALGYVIATPRVEQKFTQFYILSVEGKAGGYPKELVVGEEARVIVGIANQEHEDMTYRVEVTVDETTSNEVAPVVLTHKEKWEREISFTPVKAGENQKVEFILYKYGEDQPYRRLYLLVDVKQLR